MRLSNFKRHTVGIFLALCIIAPLMLTTANYLLPLNPALDVTKTYDKKAHFTFQLPFVHPYYLFEPPDYAEEHKYPLVLVLHGAKKRSLAAQILASNDLQSLYPSFVLMPIAPFKRGWASPPGDEFRKSRYEALALAIGILSKVQSKYPIDEDRIYVVGTSIGGFGAFGAIKKYSDIFAAAISVSGGWNPDDAYDLRKVPIWAFHSDDDPQIPVRYSRKTIEELNSYGGDGKYTEFTGVGHASWGPAYGNSKTWDWLFSQSK